MHVVPSAKKKEEAHESARVAHVAVPFPRDLPDLEAAEALSGCISPIEPAVTGWILLLK